jgi:hypothetical protein
MFLEMGWLSQMANPELSAILSWCAETSKTSFVSHRRSIDDVFSCLTR